METVVFRGCHPSFRGDGEGDPAGAVNGLCVDPHPFRDLPDPRRACFGDVSVRIGADVQKIVAAVGGGPDQGIDQGSGIFPVGVAGFVAP